MKALIRPLFLVVIFSALAACSTTQVPLDYQSADSHSTASNNTPTIAIGAVSDSRKHSSHWLGAIRGGMGNPLKTLETEQPVAEIVKSNYLAGLKARNLLAAEKDASYLLNIEVVQFDCNQVVRREAHARMRVSLLDRRSGREAFSREFRADQIDEGGGVGIFASVEKLRALAASTLNEVVNQTLDDTQLLAQAQRNPSTATTTGDETLKSTLSELKSLRDKGVLSEEEYRRKVIQAVE